VKSVLDRAPWLVVTAVGLALLWPIPLGRMPLSADHTVHLTRAWLYAQTLASGNLRGWSPAWFFGTPVGDLYPVLGDLGILAVHTLTAGLLGWSGAYAIAFALVFLAQGWVLLRAGSRLRLGPWPGLTAALLALLDTGAYREGGWIYTVFYGVWPQTLATSLTWWAIAELCDACRGATWESRRGAILRAAIAMTAALLAHPMAMLNLAVALPCVLLAMARPFRTHWRPAAASVVWVTALAFAWSAWWILPMLDHRAWMASYGWLWLPLRTMLAGVASGHWCQEMPSFVGHGITAGMVLTLVLGNQHARAFAATSIVLWTLASRDIVWDLRLDLVSDGFTHLQYQRFLTAAKPGLYLVAGFGVGTLAKAFNHPRLRAGARVLAASVFLGFVAASASALTHAPYGREIQRERLPQHPALDADYTAASRWLADAWAHRDTFWRTTVAEPRNLHWFMDLPVGTGMPVFKQGFTPGDNFVHKPERGDPRVLERARVRYRMQRKEPRGGHVVARFGEIWIEELPYWQGQPIAWLEGPGDLEILEDRVEDGLVRLRLRNAEASTIVTFGIAGYPRWHLQGPAGEVTWHEAPIFGDSPTVTGAQRRAGELRGGKALGDDGSEPTLLQAPAVTDGEYLLIYRAWTTRDALALFVTALGVLLAAVAWHERRLDQGIQRLAHAAIFVALVLGLSGFALQRRTSRLRAEARTALGVVRAGNAHTLGVRPGFLKADMLIRPALLVDRRRRKPASATFEDVSGGAPLEGWFGLDDDEAQLRRAGRHTLRIEARLGTPPGSDHTWTVLLERTVPHRPGIQTFSLPAPTESRYDLRVIVESDGDRPPELGFGLKLPTP